MEQAVLDPDIRLLGERGAQGSSSRTRRPQKRRARSPTPMGSSAPQSQCCFNMETPVAPSSSPYSNFPSRRPILGPAEGDWSCSPPYFSLNGESWTGQHSPALGTLVGRG